MMQPSPISAHAKHVLDRALLVASPNQSLSWMSRKQQAGLQDAVDFTHREKAGRLGLEDRKKTPLGVWLKKFS